MDLITLSNFRCFRDEQATRLAPLTLLVGENSTGKTSFLALIRALWDLACGKEAPNFKEPPYDLGSFDDIVHRRSRRTSDDDTFSAGCRFSYSGCSFEVLFAKRNTAPFPVRRRLSRGDAWLQDQLDDGRHWRISYGTRDGEWEWDGSPAFDGPMVADTNESDRAHMTSFFLALQLPSRLEKNAGIRALRGDSVPTDEDWNRLQQLALESRLGGFGRPLWRPHAGAPVRSRPRRTYDPAQLARDPEGDYIPTYLADMFRRSPEEWTALRRALDQFGKQSGLFDEISVRSLGSNEADPFQVHVRKYGNKTKGPRRNLIDVGYGVSQVLPVVSELLRADAQQRFLLQQPEVHLHPSAQAAFGTLLCQIAGRDRQLIVETHSDHLLDRVRMDVRDRTTNLTPDDVSILFFERGDQDVRIHSLRLDERGNVLGAPPNYRRFFLDETNRSIGL